MPDNNTILWHNPHKISRLRQNIVLLIVLELKYNIVLQLLNCTLKLLHLVFGVVV